jgi:deoxyribodipyrimidine photo-lyase
MKKISIHWFRNDLRINDNPSLKFAAENGKVIPIFIHDTVNNAQKEFNIGEASAWWLHYSLDALNKSLDEKVNFFSGDPFKIIKLLIKNYDIESVSWNRCYSPWEIKRDTEIKTYLKESNIKVSTFNSSLLWEPWEVLKDDNSPYKVFSPFYKKGCLKNHPGPRKVVKKIENIVLNDKVVESLDIKSLDLLPNHHWKDKLAQHWNIGEAAAMEKYIKFRDSGLLDYKQGRNFPAKENVSMLSPHIHFGEISPHQIWFDSKVLAPEKDIIHFHSELGWREFSYYLIYHFPHMCTENLNKQFDKFPWQINTAFLKAWQQGKTGYPIVDAGMRELWETGYMHNRVRMIVASFLVKNLLIDWRVGLEWFNNCLCDSDLANNTASWQWTAGSGADAAPYFRIFNPILQGKKFDPDGSYTKKYVPELKHLPKKYLFEPWEADDAILKESGIDYGVNYPKPIVSVADSRDIALQAFDKIKKITK